MILLHLMIQNRRFSTNSVVNYNKKRDKFQRFYDFEEIEIKKMSFEI